MCLWCDYARRKTGDPDDRRAKDEFELIFGEEMAERIRRDYWTVLGVEGLPPFAYTIGLWSQGFPELVVFGLELDEAARVLNAAGAAVRRHGPLTETTEYQFGCYRVQPFVLPNPGQVLLKANAFYGFDPPESVPAMQLVYADAHGTFPWEPDCHLFPGQQPMPGGFAA